MINLCLNFMRAMKQAVLIIHKLVLIFPWKLYLLYIHERLIVHSSFGTRKAKGSCALHSTITHTILTVTTQQEPRTLCSINCALKIFFKAL